MGENKLSIIMPVYNVGRFVENAVQSILHQTYKNLELVLVDDGSTDGSREICQQLAESDSRVKLICKKNEGVSIARNAGLDMATGDYITFADSDDWVEADAYEKQMLYIQETKADICVMGFTPEGSQGFIKPLRKEKAQVIEAKLAVEKLVVGKIYTWSLWDKIYNRKVVCDLRFATDIANGEDLLFNWQAFCSAAKVAYLPLHGYHYIQRMDSMTNSFSAKKLTVVKAFSKVMSECKNELFLQEIINDKYISTMVSLFIGYWRENKYSSIGYEFSELKEGQIYLRKHWLAVFRNNMGIKMKIAAFIIMLPPVFMKIAVKVRFR